MKLHSTLIAGAALAAMALVPAAPAAAGGGVQLNFGGPLGTFTARPHGGGHYDHGHSHRSHRAHKHDYARKQAIAERKAAARRARIAESREHEAERRRAAAEQKLAAKRKAAEIAKRKAVAAAKEKADERARRVAAAKRTEDKPEIVKAEVAEVEKVVKSDKVEIAEAVPVPVKASSITSANALIPVAAIESGNDGGEVQLKTIDVETKVDANTEVAANETDSRSPAEQDLEGPQSCKKFVPSAGLTITVPCGD